MVCMLNTNGGWMKDQVDLNDKTIKNKYSLMPIIFGLSCNFFGNKIRSKFHFFF